MNRMIAVMALRMPAIANAFQLTNLMSSPPRLQRTEAMMRKMMAWRRCGIVFLFIFLAFSELIHREIQVPSKARQE